MDGYLFEVNRPKATKKAKAKAPKAKSAKAAAEEA